MRRGLGEKVLRTVPVTLPVQGCHSSAASSATTGIEVQRPTYSISGAPQALCTTSLPLLQLKRPAGSLHGPRWKMASSLLISNSPWTRSILTGRTQEILLDLGNEETRSLLSVGAVPHIRREDSGLKEEEKSLELINSRLQVIVESRKYPLGFEPTLKMVREGKVKLVVLTSNCPASRQSEIEPGG
ncbi:hypothetical protein GH733_008622, partial [Mirounga leonina]